MGRPRREIQALNRRLRSPQPWHGPPDQLLVDGRGPSVERTTEQVAVRLLESERTVDVATDDPVTEARGKPLHLRFEPFDDGLHLSFVPLTGDTVRPRVRPHRLRHVRVAPGRLGARR